MHDSMEKFAKLLADVNQYFLLANSSKNYGPYRRSDGRQIMIIQDNDDGKSHTISYPKWLMEQHLGRKLLPHETVDHWDSNVDNNSLDNLFVIDRAEHSKQDTRRVKHLKLTCSMCKKEFERSPRLLREKSKRGSGGPFCSRSCSGRYNRLVQLKQMDKLPAQDYIESEYYKQKYVSAVADYLLNKYGVFFGRKPETIVLKQPTLFHVFDMSDQLGLADVVEAASGKEAKQIVARRSQLQPSDLGCHILGQCHECKEMVANGEP